MALFRDCEIFVLSSNGIYISELHWWKFEREI